jgi:hypothetical protein
MYAVELFFDDSFEKYVKGIWKELKDANITSNMHDIIDLRPHITLAVYHQIPSLESFFSRLNIYFESVSELELKFDVLALFPTSGTLFMDPTITEEFIKMHKRYHEEFKDLHEFANPYYVPDHWDPHCTLGIKLSAEQILDAMKYCYKDFMPKRGRITEVGIVKLAYDENHKCISSPTINLTRLKTSYK